MSSWNAGPFECDPVSSWNAGPSECDYYFLISPRKNPGIGTRCNRLIETIPVCTLSICFHGGI